MIARKAANVLPVPVGDAIRMFLRERMIGHALLCARVGRPKRRVNQSKTGEDLNELFRRLANFRETRVFRSAETQLPFENHSKRFHGEFAVIKWH